MVDNINLGGNLPAIQPIQSTPAAPVHGGAGANSFKEVLMDNIRQVNALQADADRAIENLTTGQTQNVAEVLTAVQKADLAFKTLLQIRNKLMDAYDEVKQIRI